MSSWGWGSKFSNLQAVNDFSIFGSKSSLFYFTTNWEAFFCRNLKKGGFFFFFIFLHSSVLYWKNYFFYFLLNSDVNWNGDSVSKHLQSHFGAQGRIYKAMHEGPSCVDGCMMMFYPLRFSSFLGMITSKMSWFQKYA